MNIRKFRWSRVYESSEEELSVLLEKRNIQAIRMVGEASSEQLQQIAKLNTTIWCVEGSLVVHTETASTSLQPGDAMRIDSQSRYDLHSGLAGYVCYFSN